MRHDGRDCPATGAELWDIVDSLEIVDEISTR
jgi:hypothetical protein